MKNMRVKLGHNSYEIRVGSGILSRAGDWLKVKGFSGKAVIITDSNVKGLYAGVLEKSLAQAGFIVTVLEVQAGEAQKTLETAGHLYHRLAEAFAERSTLILALGGGVIGDLAGFVAATYMRGVPYVQVPTSLLAMTDSSIGGKTAVDLGQVKNVVGAFYQPKMVIADIDTLKTLPEVELSNGMAEVMKMAAIGSGRFFKYLEDNILKAVALDVDVLENIVGENAAQKAKVVGQDEKETGQRIILNYGHTIGHAVEAVSDFKLKHGQSVAIGMVAENKIARRMGLLSADEADRILKIIGLAGLPVAVPDFTPMELSNAFELIKHDKKVFHDNIRFVLLQAIGRPVVCDNVTPGLIGEVLSGSSA